MIARKPHALFQTRERTLLRSTAVVGAAVFLLALAVSPMRAWDALLLNGFYFTGLALASLVIVCIHYLSKAGWSTVLRRIPEAMAKGLPIGTIMMLALALGARHLYPWALPEAAGDPSLHGKAAFLNFPGFIARALLYFLVWNYLAGAIVANSRKQDQNGDSALTDRNQRLAALYLIVFAGTFTLACIDWLMSLEPEWYSTLYAWYMFAGTFVNALAVVALVCLFVKKRGIVPEINLHHVQDLGRYVFAFCAFWAYLWFCQYLLIWYSNIPEETRHYVVRLRPGWGPLFWMNPIINFVIPFFLLLPAWRKRDSRSLTIAGGLLVVGHWLDLYLQAAPDVIPGPPAFGWIELLTFAAAAAAFLLLVDRQFASAAPLPVGDPMLEESLRHHG